MSTRDYTDTPQVRVSTPRGTGWLQRIWMLGERWMSTVDHIDTLQLYPLEQLGPVRTDKVVTNCSHVVTRARVSRRARRMPIWKRALALVPLTIPIVMVGLAWLNGWGI